MSNTKYEVTVYDRVPATAAVSVAQVSSYLIRAGWSAAWLDEETGWLHWKRSDERTATRGDPVFLDEDIEQIALLEKRQPSAVLADIAREPES